MTDDLDCARGCARRLVIPSRTPVVQPGGMATRARSSMLRAWSWRVLAALPPIALLALAGLASESNESPDHNGRAVRRAALVGGMRERLGLHRLGRPGRAYGSR